MTPHRRRGGSRQRRPSELAIAPALLASRIPDAASGVGHLAVQLAKFQGIERVVAAVSSHAKAEFLRDLGADEIVTYDSEHWGEPVDVVLDSPG